MKSCKSYYSFHLIHFEIFQHKLKACKIVTLKWNNIQDSGISIKVFLKTRDFNPKVFIITTRVVVN